jgi:hypothetical protein
MSFSDYKTIAQVQAEFKIKYQEENFVELKECQPSPLFLEEFYFNQRNMDIFSSESARCEIIIFPILREIYKNYYAKTSLWIQKSITVNEHLSGTPDYMISKKSELGKTMLEFPLLIIAEAKRNDFEQGWAQCVAELIAAQSLNHSSRPLYGIVTDGKLWEFGRLVDTVFTKNIDSVTSSDLSELFARLNFIFYLATQDLP